MKAEDYEAMLLAISQALEICEQATPADDPQQRELCGELRVIQQRLLEIVASFGRDRSAPEEERGNGAAAHRPNATR